MVELKDVVDFLDKEIQIESVSDRCQNGLQIQGKKDVNKIALSVDMSLNTIREAIKRQCDLIISHHALIWDPQKVLKGLLSRKIRILMKNDLSVYTAHLPLDVHKKYSHSKLMADELGLYGTNRLGKSEGEYYGFSGNIRKKMSLEEVKKMIDTKLNAKSRIYAYGTKEISSIGIVSGGGGFAVEEAAEKGMDCFITGEMKHSDLLAAKDLKLNVVLAGHYETEKLGMIKLSHSITKKFKIQCVFVES